MQLRILRWIWSYSARSTHGSPLSKLWYHDFLQLPAPGVSWAKGKISLHVFPLPPLEQNIFRWTERPIHHLSLSSFVSIYNPEYSDSWSVFLIPGVRILSILPTLMQFLQINTTTVIKSTVQKHFCVQPIFPLEIFCFPVVLKSTGVEMSLPKCAFTYALNHFPAPSWCFIGRKLILHMNHRIMCLLQKTSLY